MAPNGGTGPRGPEPLHGIRSDPHYPSQHWEGVEMYGMYHYKAVRQFVILEGHSKRDAATHFGLARGTIDKIMENPEPPGYQRSAPPVKPKIDPHRAFIDEILKTDKAVPRKQRHTAQRIFERLRDERGFDGGYTTVKDYVREQKLRTKERFLPLAHEPGHAQVDFGEGWVRIGGVEQKAHVFGMELPHSNHVFYRAYPAENTEALLDGHVAAFAFFGGVPQSILYDNMSQIVASIEANKNRQLTHNFQRLISHYVFGERFARVATGNDKGSVEAGVKRLQRSFLTPIPSVGSWDELNQMLEGRALGRMNGHVHGKPGTISERFQADQAALRPLPAAAFDPCVISSARAASTSLVRFKTYDYSVPVAHAHQQVTIRSYAWRMVLAVGTDVVARHERSYETEQLIADPLHYLPLLEQKPRALDQAAPLQGWEILERLAPFRQQLQAHLGPAGNREFIHCLQLIPRYGQAVLERAAAQACRLGTFSHDAIHHLIRCDLEGRPPRLDLREWPHLPIADVQTTSAAAYLSLVERAGDTAGKEAVA